MRGPNGETLFCDSCELKGDCRGTIQGSDVTLRRSSSRPDEVVIGASFRDTAEIGPSTGLSKKIVLLRTKEPRPQGITFQDARELAREATESALAVIGRCACDELGRL